MKKFFVLISMLFATNVYSGEIARGYVDQIANTISVRKSFAIRFKSGAEGPCADTWIEIKEANFDGNVESYKFAFSLANTAFVTNKRIRIHNYADDSCEGATFIGLYSD